MRKLLILGLFLCASLGMQAAEEFGIASYYSDAFHGRKTASGELYHKDKLTAAHKTLPFGTVIRVTRLDNKTSVIVTVNDRGPYIKGRIVDISKAAALKLDLVRDGHARVKIEVLEKGKQDLVADTAPVPNLESLSADNSKPPVADLIIEEKKAIIPTEFTDKSPERILPVETTPVVKPTNEKPKAEPAPGLKVTRTVLATMEPKKIEVVETGTLVKGQDYKDFDLYKIQLMRPTKGGFGVQVASMTQYENVLKQVAELQEKWFNNILVSVEKGKNDQPVYKLILGPFPERDTANSYKIDLKKKKKMDGFVVDLAQLNH
ncbi:MAG: rare lipoprotein A [Saprospiraceae bacterium]|jgi:rare lipoprotein A